jgi:hypothetical protein
LRVGGRGATRSQAESWSPLMIAIAAILVFVIVLGALNFFEFGRLD